MNWIVLQFLLNGWSNVLQYFYPCTQPLILMVYCVKITYQKPGPRVSQETADRSELFVSVQTVLVIWLGCILCGVLPLTSPQLSLITSMYTVHTVSPSKIAHSWLQGKICKYRMCLHLCSHIYINEKTCRWPTVKLPVSVSMSACCCKPLWNLPIFHAVRWKI